MHSKSNAQNSISRMNLTFKIPYEHSESMFKIYHSRVKLMLKIPSQYTVNLMFKILSQWSESNIQILSEQNESNVQNFLQAELI